MRIDAHVHTSPGSRCSKMRVSSYLEAIIELELEAACLTNHGELRDYDHLARIAPAGLLLIPGVEISSEEGDFIFFSTDYDYLDSLLPSQRLPDREERPEETAVVWAHPFAAIGVNSFSDEYIAGVAARVDGIEVYNGNWIDEQGVELARRVALEHDLAELGGSDAHRRENLLKCWTEVDRLESADDFIAAVKARQTTAMAAGG